MTEKITTNHKARIAYIYIRQSSPYQVQHNLESQRRSMDWPNEPASGASPTCASSMRTSASRQRTPISETDFRNSSLKSVLAMSE